MDSRKPDPVTGPWVYAWIAYLFNSVKAPWSPEKRPYGSHRERKLSPLYYNSQNLWKRPHPENLVTEALLIQLLLILTLLMVFLLHLMFLPFIILLLLILHFMMWLSQFQILTHILVSAVHFRLFRSTTVNSPRSRWKQDLLSTFCWGRRILDLCELGVWICFKFGIWICHKISSKVLIFFCLQISQDGAANWSYRRRQVGTGGELMENRVEIWLR